MWNRLLSTLRSFLCHLLLLFLFLLLKHHLFHSFDLFLVKLFLFRLFLLFLLILELCLSGFYVNNWSFCLVIVFFLLMSRLISVRSCIFILRLIVLNFFFSLRNWLFRELDLPFCLHPHIIVILFFFWVFSLHSKQILKFSLQKFSLVFREVFWVLLILLIQLLQDLILLLFCKLVVGFSI